MAIPIKRYIDIGTTLVDASSGQIDLSALVFSSDAMVPQAPTNASLKAKWTDYGTNNKVVTLTADEVTALFPASTAVYKFSAKYFGYSSLSGRSPRVLNVVKTGSETPLVKFNEVIDYFSDFGAFAFINVTSAGNAGAGGLLDVALRNQSLGYKYAMAVTVTSSSAAADGAKYEGIRGLHICLDTSTTSYPHWIPLAFVAARNYSVTDGAETMMYKTFQGADATVSSETDADTYDGLFVNYVADVQSRGEKRKFYMRGVNADGVDLGAYIDAAWIDSQIEVGWIDLATGSKRIPASSEGAMLVQSLVIGVAERAIANGAITVGKVLSDTQIDKIVAYAGSGAVTAVQTNGYYVNAEIVNEEGKYVCRYVLVYAKNDTIEKIYGTHYLV